MNTNYEKSIILSKILQKEVKEENMQEIEDNLSCENVKLIILSDCLDFGLKKSVGNAEIFVKFYHDFMQATVFQDLPITDALVILKQMIDNILCSKIGNRMFLFSCIDFIMSTVIQHYHLFVYALRDERDQDIHRNDQTVDIPDGISHLYDGVEIETWTLQTKLHVEEMNFRNKEEELNETFKKMYEDIVDELEHLFVSVNSIESIQSLKSCEIADIIAEIVSKQKEAAALDVEMVMEKSKVLLQHHLEKIMITNQHKEKSKPVR